MYEPNIKQVNMTFISWFNKSAFSLHAHAMYEHNASDDMFVGPVYLRGPLQDSHLIIDIVYGDTTLTVLPP